MYVGLIVLGAFVILTIFGVFRRLLAKWEISEPLALLVSLLMIGGVLISPINIGGVFVFSIGGFLIPFLVCVALLVRAEGYEVARTLAATAVIGIVSAVLRYFFPLEHYMVTIDSGLFVGIIAGGIAFLIGRSRRGAFVSAALGVMLTNVFLFLYYLVQGLEYPIVVGVGAQFSAIVVAAVSAAITAEVAGEIMEYRHKGETDVMFMNIDKFVNTSE